jgi:hypothetical protein
MYATKSPTRRRAQIVSRIALGHFMTCLRHQRRLQFGVLPVGRCKPLSFVSGATSAREFAPESHFEQLVSWFIAGKFEKPSEIIVGVCEAAGRHRPLPDGRSGLSNVR